MDQQLTINDTDSLLRPFLDGEDELISERLLAELISTHAEPVINKIIRNKLHVSLSLAQGSHQNQDALEIAGDVCAQILSELRRLKIDSRRRPIHDFAGYVAIKAYSACADYFREKNPQRRRLRDLLRQHLNQSQTFAIWKTEGGQWLCGFQEWAHKHLRHSRADQESHFSNDTPPLLNDSWTSGEAEETLTPPDLLTFIFNRVGRPLEFNDLVTIAAKVWNVKDQPIESYSSDEARHEKPADRLASIETEVEQRMYLQRLWKEVCCLPPLQRSALLLNLRDAHGANVIFFIPHLGIASKGELAETLSMTINELATLWTELPLEDTRIADLLKVSRQQVINLRKTARERLTRRMKAIEKKDGGNK